MKKIFEMFCITMVMVMLTGCSRGGYLAKETKGEDDKFNTETYDITYQLTEEQQENYASAEYIILCNVEGVGYMDKNDDPRADEAYMFVYGGRNVELDDNGVLHGYYGKEALYAYNETNDSYTMVPLILKEDTEQVENEMRYTCSAVISYYRITNKITKRKSSGSAGVDLHIVVNEKYPNGIIRTVIHDDTQKILDLNKYDYIEIPKYARYLTRDENGKIIDHFEWEETGWMYGLSLDLSEGYHLEMRPLDDPENYYCMFYIKDMDGNYSYSELIPIPQ